MIRTFSQIERARRETLISRVDDDRLDYLSRFYGLTRPASYPVDAWRNVLINVVYQPRGTLRTLFTALDALFAPWRDVTEIDVTINADGTFTDNTLTTAHAHRFVRINTGSEYIYSWVETVDENTHTAQLNVNQCEYWDAWNQSVTGSVSFIPFFIVETDAQIKIVLDTVILSAPPTYLQTAGATRPQSQPYGGHLLNLLDLDPNTIDFGSQIEGPFPLYLTGDEAGGILGDLLRRLIPAGVSTLIVNGQFGGDIGYPALSQLVQTGSL